MDISRNRRRLGAGALVAIAGMAMLFATVAEAQDSTTVGIGENADLGEILVGPDGMTLYIFLNDEDGVSNCSGQCAVNWPPLTVESGVTPTAASGVSGTLATIERDDGTSQVTLDGQPLYYWLFDEAEGDATGQGVNDVWYVLSPSGEMIQQVPDNDDDDDANGAGGSPVAPTSGTGLASDDGSVLPASMLLLLGAGLLVMGAATFGYVRRR